MALRPGDDFDRDILDIIPERFDADADSRQARAGARLRTSVTLVLAVLAVGGIVAAGLHFVGGKRGGGAGLQVIKADDRPIKLRPDDRGGMQVPNQDKLVYERMEPGTEGDAKVERLLPAAEAPQTPPKATPTAEPSMPRPATEILRPPPVKQAVKPGEPPLPKAVPQQPAMAPPAELPPPVAATGPAPSQPSGYQPTQARQPMPPPPQVASVPAAKPPSAPPAPAALPLPAVPPAPVAVVPPKVPAAGDYVIQLGALRAADQADKEWGRIQKANHDLLGALKPDIVRVELEGKGTYWRVRAGPLSEQAARQLCTELASRNQGCIVARK
jgi:hypothetical protein